jgi:2-amino-4-hydroxy-6-hydroxymethyldihydropteridine diphosphokinase
MARVYFSTGSNQGDRLNSLVRATKLIEELIGTLISYTAVYESEPWGFTADTKFYNQVLLLDTELSPQQVLTNILEIEKSLGRKRLGRTYSSRSIDIDILFYDDKIIKSDKLVIPHPMMHQRKFVLEPLATIAPELIHPVFQVTISSLLLQTEDSSGISVVVRKSVFAELLKSINLS